MSQARRLPGRTSRSGQGSPDFPITTNNENHLCTYWGQGVQAPGPTQLGRVSPRTHLSRGPCGATGSQLSDNTGPESLGALWAVRRVRALLMAWILEASLLTGSPASCSPLPPQRLPIGELPPQRPPPQGPSSLLPSLTWGCVLTPCQSLLGGKLGCVGSQMTPVVGPDMIVARSDQPSPQSQCSQGGLPISGRGSQSRSRGWQPTELECEPWQPGSGLAPA